MRRLVAAALAWLFSTASLANTLTTDYTDLWFNPAESGWGVNVAHQKDTLFVTLFVYAPQRDATWFVAPATVLTSSTGDKATFSGPLYSTKGPWFATQFNPNDVAVTLVGTLTFTTSGPNTATLHYDASGFLVTKSVERQTWRGETMVGAFLGAREGRWSGCGPVSEKFDSVATFAISQEGDDVTIREVGPMHQCVYRARYTQNGRMGSLTGSAVCDDHITRFFTASEIQVGIEALSMRMRMSQVGTDCAFAGYGGGIRQLP